MWTGKSTLRLCQKFYENEAGDFLVRDARVDWKVHPPFMQRMGDEKYEILAGFVDDALHFFQCRMQ
jgi:hypothetical protein